MPTKTPNPRSKEVWRAKLQKDARVATRVATDQIATRKRRKTRTRKTKTAAHK